MNYTEVVKKVNIRKHKQINSVLLLLFFSVITASAQMNTSSSGPYHILGKSMVELKKESPSAQIPVLPTLLITNNAMAQAGPLDSKSTYLNYQAPKAYSFEHLAFFCRLEVKMEKASKMPVRFRLGTVDYVDRMEGKY
ncbi:MAG: hypothetical protein Sapg2KO_43180 [Saprospiraceae bacterium]